MPNLSVRDRRDKAQVLQKERLVSRREDRELDEAKASVEKLEQQLAEANAAKGTGGNGSDKAVVKGLDKDLKEERKKVSWFWR